jgi:ATP-dependent DNA ligase
VTGRQSATSGYRVQLHKDGKRVAIYSRNGNDFTERFPPIAEAVAALPTKAVILDGELTAMRADGRSDFFGLHANRRAHLCVWVFDILSQHSSDLRREPLAARRMKLERPMKRSKTRLFAFLKHSPIQLLKPHRTIFPTPPGDHIVGMSVAKCRNFCYQTIGA